MALVGCGHARPNGPEPQPRPALERQFPALAWAPADAAYVLTGQVGDMATALSEVARPLSMLPIPDLERALRDLFALNPLSVRELARIGVGLDATAVVYSEDLWPVFALPVEDPAALTAFLERAQPTRDVKLREQDGVEVVTWQPSEAFSLAYARLDGWFLVRLGAPESRPGAWLDAARARFERGGGIAAEPDLIAAAKRARERLGQRAAAEAGALAPAVLGLVRVPRLFELAGATDDCATAVAGAVQRVVVGADVSARAGEGVIAFELSPVVAAAARLGAGPPPSAGYLDYRAAAGLYGDLGVDLRWLDRALARAGCPVPGPALRDLTRMLDAYDARSVHVAVRELVLEQRRVQAAAFVGLRSRGAIDRQLDSIPGRSLLERTVSIGEQRVRVIDLGVFPRIGYVLTDEAGAVAVGGDSIDQVFGGAAGARASGDVLLAALGVRPARMPDLETTLAVVFEQIGYGSAMASRIVAQVLSRYDEAGTSLTLAGGAIELRGWYELAP